ncbi:hypothetical protein ACFVQ4_16540 [Streptomyces laurentii]|uniref:hypothetical protein n=1 Tax=Streptomyces laurentii TaxID=39478 RepID=UPI0036761A12
MAKAIAALRRPALAAWAATLLSRQRPAEVPRFLEPGESLREAHRMLDAERMQAAARQQHQLVGTLARTAAALAREAGQPVSETVLHEIEQTLHAVLAHPEIAESWSKARLVKVPHAAVDFTTVGIAPAAPGRAAPARPASVEKLAPDGRGDTRRRNLELARTAAVEADAEVAVREKALETAQRGHGEAAASEEAAGERLRGLEEKSRAARQARRDAKAAAKSADATVKAAVVIERPGPRHQPAHDDHRLIAARGAARRVGAAEPPADSALPTGRVIDAGRGG